MPRRNDIQKILLIGSGPIVIGQAAEFDYSGVQACKVLLEEEVRWLKAQYYGRSTQSTDAAEQNADQQMLFNEAEVLAAIEASEEAHRQRTTKIDAHERKRSADAGAGLGRYPLNQPWIADIFNKNRRDFRLPDLGDNPGNIAGAGLGIGGNAQRRDEFDTVVRTEIAEGAVGGDHLAMRRRNRRHRRFDLAIEPVKLGQIGLRIGAKKLG